MPKSWTDDAQAPEVLKDHAHLKDPFFYTIKRRLLGNPLNRHSLGHQRLSKRYGLGILSSDCISSSAYGSEQILIALLPAFGLAAFAILMPMTAIVLVILLIITLSYRDVINVYTKVGGAYIVSRDNFGPVVAQIAAVALMLDYIVTIAIQSAAGVAAIISTFPSLSPFKIPMILFAAYSRRAARSMNIAHPEAHLGACKPKTTGASTLCLCCATRGLSAPDPLRTFAAQPFS